MSREGIYRALSGEGNPSFATVLKIAGALGLRLSFQPATQTHGARKRAKHTSRTLA